MRERRLTPGLGVPERYAHASGDHNPIHLKDEAARALGLPRAILHGMWTMAQAARVISREAGGPLSITRLSVEFRGYGFPGEELTLDLVDSEGSASPGSASPGRLDPVARRRVDFTVSQGDRVVLENGTAELAGE